MTAKTIGGLRVVVNSSSKKSGCYGKSQNPGHLDMIYRLKTTHLSGIARTLLRVNVRDA